jgi:LysM repeat protein
VRVVLVLLLLVGTADAGRHVIQRGETLHHVATAHGCTVDAIMRANKLKTTLLEPGTVIDIPSCTIRARAQTRTRVAAPKTRPATDEDKARAALAVIDGASWVESKVESKPAPLRSSPPPKSLGAPWDGELAVGEQLPGGDGYRVRRPHNAYGASHVVDHLRHIIAEVRALYPDVHTLAIGDLSAEHGGKIAAHRSHQSGLDVDVGFYFKRVPAGYPDRFAAADDNLDLQATWALLTAFARTTDLDDGVSIMFLDYALQRRLYTWAHKRGTPEEDLEQLFQYPRGKDALVGLIRHWPNHADHVHVRFKSR